MPAEQTPEIWAGVATQYVGAWGQAAPVVQIAAIGATVIIAAIIAFAWVRKGAKHAGGGVPLEAFTHMVEEQSRQTESLRNAVDDLREAYAAAPADTVILHTLEIWHPSFDQPIRVVRDMVDLEARLEARAARDGGQRVTFIALAFDLDLPPVDTAPVPEIAITLDNVGQEIIDALEAAAISQDKIEVIYRPYLSTDLEGPQMDPPITLTLAEVEADTLRISGRARMLDAGNKSLPSITYTAQRFPGLAR
jgi:hypothetical protein